MIYDFVSAALPWVAAGLALAVCAASMAKRKKGEEPAGPDWVSRCMGIGVVAGAVVGLLGIVPVAYGVSFGMLLGVTAGCVRQSIG